MNSFLELYTDSDYRIENRDYYTGTWEYIAVSSDYIIPFQWTGGSDADYTITSIDTAGSETDISFKFYDGPVVITGWTPTVDGTWSISGTQISATDALSGDLITTNEFSMTSGKSLHVAIDTTKFSDLASWRMRIYQDTNVVYTKDGWAGWDGKAYYTATTTAADYTIVIDVDTNNATITATTPTALQTIIKSSGTYYWYDGSQLLEYPGALSGVFRLKVEHGTYTYYSDWMDTCGFSGKAKIKISSSEDYGGIKYAGGYEQFMYKNAVIRRAPQAEIEITGDKLNGERINEKVTSAIRYTMKMKCTESEYEALVHAVAATVEITDSDGKTYDAQNIEINNPTWMRTNGIAEFSFIDGNNINVWTKNNSAL